MKIKNVSLFTAAFAALFLFSVKAEEPDQLLQRYEKISSRQFKLTLKLKNPSPFGSPHSKKVNSDPEAQKRRKAYTDSLKVPWEIARTKAKFKEDFKKYDKYEAVVKQELRSSSKSEEYQKAYSERMRLNNKITVESNRDPDVQKARAKIEEFHFHWIERLAEIAETMGPEGKKTAADWRNATQELLKIRPLVLKSMSK